MPLSRPAIALLPLLFASATAEANDPVDEFHSSLLPKHAAEEVWTLENPFEADGDYFFQATFMELYGPGDLPAFVQAVESVDLELTRLGAAGLLIASAQLATPKSLRFWTASIWRGEADMRTFLRSRGHQQARRATMRLLRRANFESARIRGHAARKLLKGKRLIRAR